MRGKWFRTCLAALILLAAGCAKKRVQAPPPAPPPARQNVFALLPEPEGNSSSIVVKNQAGSQDLSQSYQATRVERADVAPSAPFNLDQPEVKRLFGAALDVLPLPEVVFVLNFDEDRDVLNAPSEAKIPAILNAIRERHSTSITVTGHTDMTATSAYNYALGTRRAQGVAGRLTREGVNATDLVVSSHGDADPLVKTPRGQAEASNRRVEVVVR